MYICTVRRLSSHYGRGLQYTCNVLKQYIQYISMALVLQGAISILKQDYKDTPSLKDSLDLAIKVLSKTIDSSKLTTDKGNITRILKCFIKNHIPSHFFEDQKS